MSELTSRCPQLKCKPHGQPAVSAGWLSGWFEAWKLRVSFVVRIHLYEHKG